MPKKKKRPQKKSYPSNAPLPPQSQPPARDASWLLRHLARLLRQIADELLRIAGPPVKPPDR